MSFDVDASRGSFSDLEMIIDLFVTSFDVDASRASFSNLEMTA
jgi:hypothetical protein